MLTKEENDALCRVGPGTLMGDLVRQYWLPFYLSDDLEADGAPERVRLCGEDLIVFRATSGQVGLVGNHCPHRGASLFFGRNEEDGLRCVYHGWKFDLAGNCVDMPNEPPESNFKHKIHHTAYPCRERNGMIWAYMGPRADPPELPMFEWNAVPRDYVHYSIRIADENFVQACEGEIDTTHIGFLHQGLGNSEPDPLFRDKVLHPNRTYEKGWSWGEIGRQFKAPRWESVDTDYGVLIGSKRDLGDGTSYWRIYPFSMPFYSHIPAGGPDPNWSGHAWVPMDDEHTICLAWTNNATHPLSEKEVEQMKRPSNGLEGHHASVDIFHPKSNKPYGQYWPRWDNDNDFNYDYKAGQLGLRFSGLPGLWTQDSGMQQSMGAIYDRTKEHLGSADTAQIRIRRRLLGAARQLQERGTPPPGIDKPEAFYMRPISVILPNDIPSWVDAVAEMAKAGGPAHPAGWR